MVLVYAILVYTKVVGGNPLVYGILALLFAIFVVISPLAVSVVAGVAPYLAVIFVFIVLISIASKMLGADLEAFPAVKGVLLVVIVLTIVIGVAVKMRSQVDNQKIDTSDLSKTVNVIFHPKFLGMILLFAVAIFTIALLAKGGGH